MFTLHTLRTKNNRKKSIQEKWKKKEKIQTEFFQTECRNKKSMKKSYILQNWIE